MTHVCEECSYDVQDHDERCYELDGEVHYHFPPLCCPDCPCGSFEEAHGGASETASERLPAWQVPSAGTRVRLVHSRWGGRVGKVVGSQLVSAGGAAPRTLAVVVLEPTARALRRTVVVYPSSLESIGAVTR